MEEKEFAEAFVTILEFIGYAAGIGAAHAAQGGEIGARLEARAMKAFDAAMKIRPLTEAEADCLRYEEAEKLLHEGTIGQIMCRSEGTEPAGAE